MRILLSFLALIVCTCAKSSTFPLTNIYGRDYRFLNGEWSIMVDPYQRGEDMKVFENRKPQSKTDFYEYSFEGAPTLRVPGDWNHQMPSLDYYEGCIWYARHINMTGKDSAKRYFLHFGAVSTRCKVYLNGQFLGSHEGAFTPFQLEVTQQLKTGDNFLCVSVDNTRRVDAIPAMVYDWWNYGGITRDVLLVSTSRSYVSNYSLILDREDGRTIQMKAEVQGGVPGQQVQINIPDLGMKQHLTIDDNGNGWGKCRPSHLQRWSPEHPRLYKVSLIYGNDTIKDEIGFRTITTRGEDILLNGQPIFMRSVSFHEEIASERRRAYSPEDAKLLLGEAKRLGCNMVRLAHYPQNEYIVRLAEQMGIILWEEVPVWQSIDFTNDVTRKKALTMLEEMIRRDINRCAVCFWGLSNETKPSTARNQFIEAMLRRTRELDNSRLVVSAFDLAYYNFQKGCFVLDDDFVNSFDVVGINKYMGWYAPWPREAEQITWNVARGHPLIITEFGGEALKGIYGNADTASSWSEDYQAELYRQNLRMFDNILNLRGVSPWVLFDFRSPFRFLTHRQDGWNRKGLLSDKNQPKKAWSLMHEYYQKKSKII